MAELASGGKVSRHRHPPTGASHEQGKGDGQEEEAIQVATARRDENSVQAESNEDTDPASGSRYTLPGVQKGHR